PDRCAIGQKLGPINLVRSDHVEIDLNRGADRSVLIPELAVLITGGEVLPDVHDPVVDAFQSSLNLLETIFAVAHLRERKAKVEPRYVVVFVDDDCLLQQPAGRRISSGGVVGSSQVALDRPPGKIGVIDVIGVCLSSLSKIGPGHLIIADAKRKPAGLNVAARLEAHAASRNKAHNDE